MFQFYGAAAGVGAASSASGYPMAAAAAAYGAVAANHHQSGHQQHTSHHQVRARESSVLMPRPLLRSRIFGTICFSRLTTRPVKSD